MKEKNKIYRNYSLYTKRFERCAFFGIETEENFEVHRIRCNKDDLFKKKIAYEIFQQRINDPVKDRVKRIVNGDLLFFPKFVSFKELTQILHISHMSKANVYDTLLSRFLSKILRYADN